MDLPLLCWVFDEVEGEAYVCVSNTSFTLLLSRSKLNIYMMLRVVTWTLATVQIALMMIATLGMSTVPASVMDNTGSTLVVGQIKRGEKGISSKTDAQVHCALSLELRPAGSSGRTINTQWIGQQKDISVQVCTHET